MNASLSDQEPAGTTEQRCIRRRALVAALGGTWLTACQPMNTSKGSTMYRLQDVAGPNVDMNSEYARHWPGEAALFKLREGLTLAIPPMYQEFWLQGDKVTRMPVPKERAPKVPLIGFDFFMPDFGGYTPDNYRQPFHQDRVQVVYLEPVEPRIDGRPPRYADIDGAISRLEGVSLVADKFDVMHGMRCFGSPVPGGSRRTCVGERFNGERMLLDIYLPPYDPGITNPIMQATYYTSLYGGMEVTWRVHMKHFSRWLEIDQQLWKFVDSWNVAK
jgi:hypothetical protein